MKRRLAAAAPEFARPDDRRERPALDQLHQRHDRAPQGRDDHPSQRLYECGRARSCIIHMTANDRYLWTLPMFHANGWTFVWTVTAVGATHVCLRKVEPRAIFELIEREQVSIFCAAPTVLIGIANAPEELRRNAPRGVRVFTAGAPPAAATIERIEGELGWDLTQVYGLTETSPFITDLRAAARTRATRSTRARGHQSPPGSRADHFGRARSWWTTTAMKCRTMARRWARSWCAAMW